MDKVLAVLCAHAYELNDEQVQRAIKLAENEGDTRYGLMRQHVSCCGRARNILRTIHKLKEVYKEEKTWVWPESMCFPLTVSVAHL